jgi:hypothetical protein
LSRTRSTSRTSASIRRISSFDLEFAEREGVLLQVKDSKRTFNEAERIRIYRRDEGLCRICLKNGAPRDAAVVPWHKYHADHIVPWIMGGPSAVDNAQVLCAAHNLGKGGRS